MAWSVVFIAAFTVGAASAPAPSLRGSAQATEGRCCFNGCGDENSCVGVTHYCATQERCLSPQPDGGCDSSPPFGQGAKPSWCPISAPQKLASNSTSSSAQASASLRTGIFQNGGGYEENVTHLQPPSTHSETLGSLAATDCLYLDDNCEPGCAQSPDCLPCCAPYVCQGTGLGRFGCQEDHR